MVHWLHLMGHWEFLTEQPREKAWCIRLQVDKARLPAVTAFLRRVQKNHSRIPYGFSPDERAWFNPSTGGLYPRELGEGMTCVTFVLALLAGAGLPLTVSETWPARKDDEVNKNNWVVRFTPHRSEMGPDEGLHFDAIAALPGSVRIRLSELLGAASDSIEPVPEKPFSKHA